MRGVWGHITRPKLSSVRVPRHRANPASRGDAALNGFQLRPVTFNDAFGIFLAPFLAAATIVNLSWKEKQKKDWDNKLAEIDREIEILRAREHDVLSRLQRSATTRPASRRERRCYSTAAVAPLDESNDVSSGSPYDSAPEPEPLPIADFSRTVQGALQQDAGPFPVPRSLIESRGNVAIEDVPEAVWEVERLIAMRLALEMVVMAHLGDAPTAGNIHSSLPRAQEAKPPYPASLLDQLQRVKHLELAARQKTFRHAGFIPDYLDLASGSFMALLQHLTNSYKDGNLTYVQLLENISEALVNSRTPPTIRHYTALVKFLHDHMFTSFVPLVTSALSRSRLTLDETACERVLEHVGHSRDVKAFDWWLAEFTKVNSRLVLTQRWEWHRLNGEKLPLPSSSDPRLIKTLTFTALSLEQVSRAEAWSSVMRHENYRGEEWADLIKAFLLYYTKQADWIKGRAWVREVIETPTLADPEAFRSFKDFGTLIYRMLALCVECGKKSQYAEILRAAVAANVKPPEIELRKPGSHQGRTLLDIGSEWSWMIDTGPGGRNFTDEMRVAHFQEALRSSEMYEELERLGQEQNQSNPSLPVMQQATFDKLTAQLSESKQKLDQQLEEARKLQASLQTMLTEQINKREGIDTKLHSDLQMPPDKRWEEQQSALVLLQKELSRHRELIEHELKDQRQQQHHVHSPPPQIEDMQQYSQKINQDSGPPPSGKQSKGLHQLMAVPQKEQMKKVEKNAAATGKNAEGVATNTLPSPSIYEPATDAGLASSSGIPTYNSGSDITNHPCSDVDSDSGYSSDSSHSSHVGDGVNSDYTNRLPVEHGRGSPFAWEDQDGRFFLRKFRGDPSGVGLTDALHIPVYLGEGGCHRVEVDFVTGRDEELSEEDETSTVNSLEATSDFFNTIDSIYPEDPPAGTNLGPRLTTEDSTCTSSTATTAITESTPEPLLTTEVATPQTTDDRAARRSILDMDAELEEIDVRHTPTEGPDSKAQEPDPEAEASKEEDARAIRINLHRRPVQSKSEAHEKAPTVRIRKQKGFGGMDSLKLERRLQAASVHANYRSEGLLGYRKLDLNLGQS